MELKQIETLLESYELGETSLVEEAQLKVFFNSPDVPNHLEHYRVMFQYFSKVEQQTFDADLPLKRTISYFKIISIALDRGNISELLNTSQRTDAFGRLTK